MSHFKSSRVYIKRLQIKKNVLKKAKKNKN